MRAAPRQMAATACVGCAHCNYLGLQTQQVAHGNQSANAGSHADTDIDGIESGNRTEQLEGIGCDADDEISMERRRKVQACGGGHTKSLVLRFVKVLAILDDAGAEAGDGGILVARIVARHVNCRWNSAACGGKRDGLAVIASRCRYDAGTLRLGAAQPVQVHESAPDLECPRRCVIFVFHPHAAPRA
jgi:hypothetical protein